MPYLSSIFIPTLRHLSNVRINLEPGANESFSHLILTGPNGSGKTTLVQTLARQIATLAAGRRSNRRIHETQVASLERMLAADESEQARHEHEAQLRDQQRALQADWATFPLILAWRAPTTELNLRTEFETGKSVFAFLPARRRLELAQVNGPVRIAYSASDLFTRADHPTTSVAERALQVLVNKKTEATFAQVDGDESTAGRINDWLDTVRSGIGVLLEDPTIQMRFDRSGWTFSFVRTTDGRAFDLNALSHGHASAIQIFSDILVRFEAARAITGDPAYIPSGVAIIDEIETHLHLSLQRTILPFLTQAFPTIQFIVATHSPAVVASVANAVVYDLARNQAEASEYLRGMRYGEIATGHFGIKADYDTVTQQKLHRLSELANTERRSADEASEMRTLADELAARGYNLAVEVKMWIAASETPSQQTAHPPVSEDVDE